MDEEDRMVNLPRPLSPWKRTAMMHIMKYTVLDLNICHPTLLDFYFAAMLALRYTPWFGRVWSVI
jgi:hypothetical protein